jgi:hypothetical protein
MAGQAGLLELSAGSEFLLAGTQWTVAAIEAQHGRVLLRSGGEERWRSIRWLSHHPDCRPVPDDDAGAPSPSAGRQPPVLDDLTGLQRQVVWLRVAHLLEAETGFRSGDPLRPEPGEPRPGYDQRSTTLGQRRRAKAAELQALGGQEAAVLGLGKVSERTLERMAAAWKDRGPAGCIDGRWVRPGGGHPSITGEVREAIFEIRRETKDRSRTGMRDKYVLICQYVAEKYGPGVPVPGFWTLRAVWLEWFGPCCLREAGDSGSCLALLASGGFSGRASRGSLAGRPGCAGGVRLCLARSSTRAGEAREDDLGGAAQGLCRDGHRR